jgi:hypothetical protein
MGLEEHGKKKEEEWIKEQERKKIEEFRKKREQEVEKKIADEEEKKREELKRLHYMCCPKCGHKMEEVSLVNVKVDKCTVCEGIFFDRGELEDLIMTKAEEKRNFFRKLLGL